jgi:hypothetical protein
MQIWKYSLLGEGGTGTFLISKEAKIVTVAMQGGVLCFWAIVDPARKKVSRSFSVIGTGYEIPKFSEYVGTAFDGGFVWHLFEQQV